MAAKCIIRAERNSHALLIRGRELQRKKPTSTPARAPQSARSWDDRPLMRSEFREQAPQTLPARSPRVEYCNRPDAPLPENVLAIVRFGAPARPDDGEMLAINIGLEPLGGTARDAIWHAAGPVSSGRHDKVRFAHDGEFLFGVIEEREADHADVRSATAAVYAAIDEFRRSSGSPHLLRMWNFIDAVNEGDGDLERYRQFCIGRAEGFGKSLRAGYPAATAIGRQRSAGLIQVFWVAAKTPGAAVENPRQVSAYEYPRVHGPVSPSFSRATVLSDGTLLISGTASIVGHVSQHPNDAAAQLLETLRNLDSLIVHARQHRDSTAADREMLLTVYVRERDYANAVIERIRTEYPNAHAIYVAADICRRELLVEIECVIQSASRAK